MNEMYGVLVYIDFACTLRGSRWSTLTRHNDDNINESGKPVCPALCTIRCPQRYIHLQRETRIKDMTRPDPRGCRETGVRRRRTAYAHIHHHYLIDWLSGVKRRRTTGKVAVPENEGIKRRQKRRLVSYRPTDPTHKLNCWVCSFLVSYPAFRR